MRRIPALLAASLLAWPAAAQQSAPNRAPRPEASVPRPPIRAFQPPGTFPSNARTNRPFVGPHQGSEGFRATVGALQRVLTELQALQLQTKQAHWNVSGTLFYPLHLLLQEHYAAIAEQADEVAERLLAIGASADGRARTIVETSAIPEFPGGFVDDAQVIAWFAQVYAQVGDLVRQAIRDTEDPDPTTSNLLQETEHLIAKFQWQMRAHFQATPTDPNQGRDLNNGQPVELPDQPPQ